MANGYTPPEKSLTLMLTVEYDGERYNCMKKLAAKQMETLGFAKTLAIAIPQHLAMMQAETLCTGDLLERLIGNIENGKH